MKIILKLLVVVFVMVSAVFVAGDPVVIWKSQPVNPGEAVMVFGGPWSSNAVVELQGSENETIDPICVTDDCLTFVYPENRPLSEFTAKISDVSGSVTIPINDADVWWIQGDEGRKSTPGGWLRVFGRSIGYNKNAFVEFRNSDSSFKISAEKFNLFDMSLTIPEDIAVGEYEVFVGNGLGKSVSAGKFEITPHKAHWKQKVFNVVDYGATANDRNDDSKAILAALADVKANGGGILYFPRGRFGMQGEIDLPPNSLLQGDGMELTQIYWLDEDNPIGSLVSGSYNFGVKDICLVSGNFYKGITVVSPALNNEWKNENIEISHVRTRFLYTDVSKKESFRRINQTAHAGIFKGENLKITDCDFLFTKGGFGIEGEYLYVANNIFHGSGNNQSLWCAGRNSVFENNNLESCSSTMVNSSRNFCFKNNVFGKIFGNGDRETFTFDGGKPNYKGTALSVGKQSVEFKKPMNWRDGTDEWIGRSISVIGGKGAGQHRFISEIDDSSVTINRPWDIIPDSESYFVISYGRNKLLFLDNYVSDGNPFQLYGYATDVVISGNVAARNSGIQSYGMTKGGFPEPNWFVQFLDNRIEEGNAVRGPWSFLVPAEDSRLGFFDRGMHSCGVVYPLARVGVMRRNVLENNAHILCGPKVENMLVENNVVKNSDVGVIVQSKGAIVRGNTFENVEYAYDVADDVVLSPAEKFAGDLQSIKVVFNNVPSKWDDYIKKAYSLNEMELSAEKLNKSMIELRQEVVNAFSRHAGDKVIDAQIVKMLLGVDLAQNSSWQFAQLKPGIDTIVRVGNGVYPESSLPATLTGVTKGFVGWTVLTQKNLNLVPGKPVSYQLNITRPSGDLPVFTLPVEYKVSGDGWSLNFKEEYGNNVLNITEFLVAGPFKNQSGDVLDSDVHPPEMSLNVAGIYDTMDGRKPWRALTGDSKGTFINSVFENTDTATAIAVAVVHADRPIRVNVDFGNTFKNLLVVNGQRVGSSARRVGVRFVELKKGDNLFQLISSNASGKWPVSVRLTAIDPVKPTDLRVLSVDELKKSELLNITAAKQDSESGFGNADIDWKLIVDDNFNRTRLGTHWIHDSSAPGYRSVGLNIIDGTLGFYGAGGTVSYFKKVEEPVRIEFDVFMEHPRAQFGVLFGNKGRALTMFDDDRRFGYMIAALGIGHRTLMRNSKVMLDNKSGIYPGVEAGVWHNVVFQFAKPSCQFYFNGKLKADFEDVDWIEGLNEISLYGGVDVRFDNVKIYEGKNIKK